MMMVLLGVKLSTLNRFKSFSTRLLIVYREKGEEEVEEKKMPCYR